MILVIEFFDKFTMLKNKGEWDTLRTHIDNSIKNIAFNELMHVFVYIDQSDYEIASKIIQKDRRDIFRDNSILEFGYNLANMLLCWNTKKINNMINPQQRNAELLPTFSEDQINQYSPWVALYYNLTSKILTQEGNLTLAEKYINKGIQYYQQANDSYAIVKSMINLSVIEKDRGQYENVLAILNDALDKLLCLDPEFSIYKQLEFMIKGNIASTYLKLKRYLQAKQAYEEIDELVKSRGNEAEYCIHLTNKGSVLVSLEKFDEAQEQFDKSLNLATKIDNQYLLAYIHRNIGDLEYHKRQLSQALEHLNASLKISEELDLKIVTASNLSIIGLIFALQGQLDEALNTYLEVMDMINEDTEIFDPDFLIASYHTFAIINARRGEIDTARLFLEKQLELCKQVNEQSRISSSLFSLFHLSIDNSDEEETKNYLSQLENISADPDNRENIGIQSLYQLANSLHSIYQDKNLSRTVKTLEVVISRFDHILTKSFGLNHKIVAIYTLCEILVTFLRDRNDETYLNRVNELADQLHDIATTQQIIILEAETQILRAKLKILEFDMNSAREMLQKGLNIAKTRKLTALKQDIRSEIDRVLTGKLFSKDHDLPQLVVDSKILLFLRSKGGSRGFYPDF